MVIGLLIIVSAVRILFLSYSPVKITSMKFLLITLFLILSSSTYAQIEAITKDGKKVILNKNGTWKYAKAATPVKPTNGGLKKEALDFSMQLVRSYFAQDCSVLQQAMPDEIFTFKGVVNLTEDSRSKICESVIRAVKDQNKTFEDYVANYQTMLLSRAEVEAKAGATLPAHYNITDAEFYFLGYEQKPGVSSPDFISTRMFILLIRKVEGRWQVKGFLED